MMGQIETVFKYSRTVESILTQKFNASGRGLHQKVTSIEFKMPEDLVVSIRRLASLRNKIAHECDFLIEDLSSFIRDGEHIVSCLSRLTACGNDIFKPA
jgi:hypothetical protein